MNEIKNMNDVEVQKIRVRDIYTGSVVQVREKSISVDINTFTEGTIYLEYYTLDKSIDSFIGLVNVGDLVTAEVTKVTEESIYLSRLNLLKDEEFKKIIEAVDTKEALNMKVTKSVSKGFNVSYKGFTFFLPDSQALKTTKVQDNIVVRLLEADDRRKTGVVSERVIEQENYLKSKEEEFNTFKVGDKVKGVITKIEAFGMYVKFKYNQGLVRINQVSHLFIKNIKELYNEGDEIEVKVIGLENGKIALSKKALEDTPFEAYIKNVKIGQEVIGKCVNKLPIGLILEVAANVRGLLHTSEFSWNPNDNFMASVKIGDSVKVAILNIEEKKEKLSLSRKALIDNPWARVNAKEGDVVTGVITKIEPKGLTVETLGVDGYINANDALAEGVNGKLDDYFAIGDEITAIIDTIKPREWFLKLNIKKYQDNLARLEFEKYMNAPVEEEKTTTLGDIFKDVFKK